MNEEYTLIPLDQVKPVIFNVIEKDNRTGFDILCKYSFLVYSYKYIITEDMFVDDIAMFELIFYIGTRYYPRKTSGSKFVSTVISIQFTSQVKDKSVLKDKMWDYLYSIEHMDLLQLKKLSYKSYINTDVFSDEEKDVIETFKIARYLQ